MNTPEPLHNPKFLNTETEVFFVASAVTRITHMVLMNNNTSPVNAIVYIVPAGESATDEYIAFDNILAPKQPKVLYSILGTNIGADWSIQAKASEPGLVTLRSSGSYKT